MHAVISRGSRLLKNPPVEEAAGAKLLAEAAATSPSGLMLTVDEFGKYLEYAAREPGEDVFLLQQIAETAARSEKPLLFIEVLHTGFSAEVVAVGRGSPATTQPHRFGRGLHSR